MRAAVQSDNPQGSVKAEKFLTDLIAFHGNPASRLSGQIHAVAQKSVTKLPVEGFILLPDIFQQRFLLLQRLLGIRPDQQDGRNGKRAWEASRKIYSRSAF